MKVNTSRFGELEIDDGRVIIFESGLLGFPDESRFTLLKPSPDSVFLWLQSLDNPDLAFVVTDPSLFVTGYEVALRGDQTEALKLGSLEDGQVLVIVNRYTDCLTGNLQGPLVVNLVEKVGQQLVLSDQRWTTRHKLVEIGQPAAQAASA